MNTLILMLMLVDNKIFKINLYNHIGVKRITTGNCITSYERI